MATLRKIKDASTSNTYTITVERGCRRNENNQHLSNNVT